MMTSYFSLRNWPAFRRDRDRVGFVCSYRKKGIQLRGVLLQLIVGARPKRVGADHATFKTLPLVIISRTSRL